MLLEDSVYISREPGGYYQVEWQVTQPGVRVDIEPLAGAGRLESSAAERQLGRARFSGLIGPNRHYFRLRDQRGTEVVATERRLAMQGSPNFRDFGGYRGAGGRRLKWGYLFRSGQLSRLSERDVAMLASLDLDLICDFRRIEEQQGDPSRLPPRQPRVVSLSIVPGSNSDFFERADGELVTAQAMFDFMVEINRDFASAQCAIYARMFKEILALPDARFLVHCAAGKDRTGFAVAMIMLALGVSRETVMQDYLLTARYYEPQREIDRLRRKYGMEGLDASAILPMLEVHRGYLARALAEIDQGYDSVEDYLQRVLGVGAVERAELRRRYLE